MRIKKNIRCDACCFYHILKSELYKDMKKHVKQKDRPSVLKEGYQYHQILQIGSKQITAIIHIETLKENECYCVKAQYPKYTQVITYTFRQLDEQNSIVIYKEKVCNTKFYIQLLSFLKSHLYRMKIVQFLNHIEEKAIRKQAQSRSHKK